MQEQSATSRTTLWSRRTYRMPDAVCSKSICEAKLTRKLPRHAGSRLVDPAAEPQLSFAQERLWFLDQLNPHSAVYNVPLAIKLSGHIEPETLERSINEIVRRHEVLRTTFATVDGQPVPAIKAHAQVHLEIKDCSSLPPNQRQVKARSLLNEAAETPFDLSQGPLVRATLVSLSQDDHIFLVVMHHIVSDGWSLVFSFKSFPPSTRLSFAGTTLRWTNCRRSIPTTPAGSEIGYRAELSKNRSGTGRNNSAVNSQFWSCPAIGLALRCKHFAVNASGWSCRNR